MKKFFLYTMCLFYSVAGLNHFISPEFYLNMIPSFLPFPEFVNYASGAAEIGLGLLLLSHKYRLYACYGVILLLVAIFPANIHMFTNALNSEAPEIPVWLLAVRLPIQLLFLYWAWAVKDYQPSKTQ
ncbi:MAG: motility protein [Leptospira sp.]|nr:motility protein [Leptospira sp.]